MSVYVDDVEHRFDRPLGGYYLMCHMWADSLGELLVFADKIGVSRKYLQQPPKASWVHFDISKVKKRLALRLGAILTDKYGPVEHVARLANDETMLANVARCRASPNYRPPVNPYAEVLIPRPLPPPDDRQGMLL